MLEGAVARLLNQILGKYVVDLDTENLNVGIFSGHVQLTDLKLKPEALYELNLPIEVRAGTIGKVWLQIPWTSLWNQPIIVNIEDLHIVVGPIVSNEPFDAEKNKRLIRAQKRKVLADLDTEGHIIGGPSSFSEHLITNILNNLQLTITNIHIRYEDDVSCKTPVSAGLCISNITAEATNSKWKAARSESNSHSSYYLIKVAALSAYWNHNSKLNKWDLPSQYYAWRNSMSNSLQNFSMNDEEFEFLLKPMTTKVKMTIKKSNSGNINKLTTDIIVQDCNIQISKEQYNSILSVSNSLNRMVISWNYLSFRPKEKVLENKKIWWKYAYSALVEQRIKPYTWSKIRTVRRHYKDYMETYKQIILNPNDTELKLDLQIFEDNLSIVNIVIARQQARLLVQSRSLNEKNFWSMLPSPERVVLCEKIGFYEKVDNDIKNIEHKYNLRMGNITAALVNENKEVFVLTLTQFNLSILPNFVNNTYKSLLKIEGLIIEGASVEDHLTPIVSSEHLVNSPAYFLKIELEKMPSDSICTYKLNVNLDSVECIYHKQSINEIENFMNNEYFSTESMIDYVKELPSKLYVFLEEKLSEKWDMTLNIKIPYLVLPENGSFFVAENILIVDLGRYVITTELCQPNSIAENATQMELEEQLYSKLHVEVTDVQILFCDSSENWKDAKKEKDTELHVIPKTSFTAMYAKCTKHMKTIPNCKFNINFPILKLNVSERRICLLLKFFHVENNNDNQISACKKIVNRFTKDMIAGKIESKYLLHVQNNVHITDNYIKTKRTKSDKNRRLSHDRKSIDYTVKKGDMNEAYARYVDLPGLEDNISPNNNIITLFRVVVTEFTTIFSRSSDSTDRQYLMFRLGLFTMDVALMTYGPAYQISLNSILLTDKLHTTPSGQYLDLVYSPVPNTVDVVTVLYRKVSASCPDFWSHFHGVETSLVADFGTINLLLHQEAVHTVIKYSKYMNNKIKNQISPFLSSVVNKIINRIGSILHKKTETPVPPGSVKFSHSARLTDLNIRVCDSDFDIINIQLSGLEMDFLFRANERFVFRTYLSNINVEHLSDITLYSKVLSTDEDKVFEIKYVRHAPHIKQKNDISPSRDDILTDGSFKLQLGQIHITFLYKLIVQLQRFILNLEALPYIENGVALLHKAVKTATDTLKASTKIHLAINICGPVFLFPQKSSSPNVLVIDTGDLHVENFFKEYSNDTIENILLKWNSITITRGVMTMAATLEMQETLIEPVNLGVDIKRYTNVKTHHKSWDVDGVLDTIQITLGQKDLNILLCIYNDNIGEGKIIDLFPDVIKSPTDVIPTDETVKTLEAFFCEPKQKNIVAKFSLDGIKLLLFFDSGELLSSPIRDLNHGLCKLEVIEINTSFIIYTDKSLDGKLAVDTIIIEEIGPDVNVYDKGILQSPVDDSKNNNCNITVNKPPIVDVTFHQNKTGDKSIDVIVGRLSLSLSVPFTEKLALFIIECLPKDNLEVGIINHGYEADSHQNNEYSNPNKNENTSLTVAIRINKPELIFLIETTSNKKRYFITKCEILSDYSRHSNRLNFVISLSGLHTLFYDLGSHNSYVVLRQCDLEFSKCYLEEKGDKITLSISSVYVQICSAVVHSINDILNSIVEHFKIPDEPCNNKTRDHSKGSKPNESDDLWESKKLIEFVDKTEVDLPESKPKNSHVTHEILILPKFDVVVIFELEEIQVLLLQSTMEVTVYDWSYLLNCTIEFTIQANYFNENLQTWEPLIDPIVLDEKEYKSWDVLVKVFQDKSHPMLSENDNKKERTKLKKMTQSEGTTEDDEDSGEDMVYLEPINSVHNRTNRRVKTSLSTFLDDSDSENEDGAMEKLAAAISDLFTGDWNESDDSDCVHSSDGDEESDENVKSTTKSPHEHQEFDLNCKKSTYVLIDAKETLNITVTHTFLKVFNEVLTMYSNKTLSIASSRKSINIVNDIGPHSKVELFEKHITNSSEDEILVYTRTFENQESVPNSPTKSNLFQQEFNEDPNEDKESFNDEYEVSYDVETISSLQFPVESTSHLFDKINKHFIKIHIPNFLPLQTNCSKKNWEKLLRLHSVTPCQTYYLAAKHTIGKYGRNITISSPLQIKNETCFALSVLYQPSVLQQLNLEPVGDVTNPFETTMRIAVLEAHEQYNVPLYIAYHCKLFIQPAYAEGHYASDSGIWWQDLATELDVAHNLRCKPKNDSHLEVFSLRVLLKRNLNVKNSLTHSIPNYIIHLLPPLVLHNFLPYTLEVENLELKQFIKVEPGEKSSVYSLDLTRDQKMLVTVKFQSQVWSGTLNLTTHLDEKIVVLSTEGKENTKHLAINVKSDREGSCNIFFYTPYWIINKTELPLQIRASATNSVYDSANEDVLLFTYKRHGKQTLNVRVYESNWSNEFGLECAGTTGLVICKDTERKKKYFFFLTIRLSEMCPRLTKIVSLLPSFLITNNTERQLRFMEHNEKTDLWIDLPPNQTVVFWPETSSMQIYVKYRESKLISQAFYIASPHTTVLRMDKGSALSVEVTGGISNPFRIILNEYKPGDAPVLIKNYCADLFLKIQQQGQSQVTLLSPYNMLLYTWDDPSKPRRLVWNVYNNKGLGFLIDIIKDGYGEEKIKFHSVTPTTSVQQSSSSEDDSDSSDSVKTTLNKKVRKDKIVIYWLCYREGLQRTLIFTQELRIYNSALKNVFYEHCNFECLVSLSGIGFSIFTSENATKEHVYMSIVDAPAIWEVNIGHKWKTLTLELASWIEDKYKLHYKKCQLKDYIHIDFEKMFMLKPFFAELRRTYYPAVYLHLRKSANHQHVNFKIHSFQIDNKYSNSVALYSVPTENSNKCLNSFIDLTLFKSSSKDCDVYKYVKLNIGNLYLNIESELFLELTKLVAQNKKFFDETITGYRSDMTTMHALLTMPIKETEFKTVIETLSMSGFVIQVNISNKAQISLTGNKLPFNKFLDYLFPINISPYMPMEGVHHKISAIEQVDLNENLATLICNLFEQTTTQFLQQYYSHVLGLQVLVNTFAIQAIPTSDNIQTESEKMAGILLYGSRCLLGHINMSPAALEQCVIDIFANQCIENIQRMRRHGSYQKSDIVPKSITASSRNFSTGVPSALSQLIVTNQNAGMNCDGEMFFRTTGKALLSLITRHPDEKSDSVEVAKEALRRAFILGEPIRIHQRLTRYSNKYLGIKPFSVYESIGHHLLETVGNCRFVNDTYWTHAATDKIGKSIILISLEHVIRVNKCRLWGPWELDWTIELDDIISIPKITSGELIFNLRETEMNAAGAQIKISGDKEMLSWLHEKIEQAIIVSMEDKSWALTENL